MVYVALLRGINVGGNRPVSMAQLKETFEGLGFDHVRTHINSGNVIFSTRATGGSRLTQRIEVAVEARFALPIKVVLRDRPAMEELLAALPDTWVNDARSKCDVIFLADEIDRPEILEKLPSNPSVEETRYTPGAVIWRVDRDRASESRRTRVVGTTLYRSMTIRNSNTVRKVCELMSQP